MKRNSKESSNITLSICSFSWAKSDTEPNTSLNSFRYRFDFSDFAKMTNHGHKYAMNRKMNHLITYNIYDFQFDNEANEEESDFILKSRGFGSLVVGCISVLFIRTLIVLFTLGLLLMYCTFFDVFRCAC